MEPGYSTMVDEGKSETKGWVPDTVFFSLVIDYTWFGILNPLRRSGLRLLIPYGRVERTKKKGKGRRHSVGVAL